LTGRERVYVFEHGDEEGLATVLSRGAEISRVRFDRADIYGKEGNISNSQLKPAPAKKKSRKPEPEDNNDVGLPEIPD
jgi:hypothetical protein